MLHTCQIINKCLWYFVHYLPFFFLYFSLTWLLLGQAMRLSTMATAYASFYPYLMGLFSVIFNTEERWIATTSRRSNIDPIMKWIWPHMLIILLSFTSLVIGWYNPPEFWSTFFNSIWVVITIFLLGSFLLRGRFK